MNKKIGLVAAGVLAAGLCLTGCGGSQNSAGTTEKQTSFTYWVPMNSNIATRVQSFNDIEMYKQREEDSGIHIEFIHPALGQQAEQFNLMVASRQDMPDFIEYSWNLYPGGLQKALDGGVIISLNEYLDKGDLPNLKKIFTDYDPELSPIYDRDSKTDSGQYYGFPSFDIGEYRSFGGIAIRRDWLNDAGLEIPETIDEWTTALRAFKEQKGATAPLTGEAKFIISGAMFNGAYNVGTRLYLDDKTVKFGPLEPAFKDYISTMHQWYQEGLLDQDFGTNKSTMVDSNIVTGKSGAMAGCYLGGGMGRYLAQMETTDPSYDLACAPYPVLNKGEINNMATIESDTMGNAVLAITTACKDPETAAKWADYWYSDDGYKLVNFGVEGKSYNMVDGYPTYADDIIHNPEGMSIAEALGMQCRATSPAPGLKQAPEYLEQYYQYQQQKDGFKMWAENVPGTRKNTVPAAVAASSEETEELASITADLETYVQEMLLKFITGEESMDNYDNFVQTLHNNFRVDRYLEIEQAMYDRYLQR